METPTRHKPTRTCVGCRQEAAKQALIRIVRTPAGAVALDPAARAPGRGAYLHAAEDCLALARKRRALERALKASVSEALWADLAAAAQVSGKA